MTLTISDKNSSAQCLEAPQGPFLANFETTSSELGQERTHIRCYEDILLTVNYHKICQNKLIIKRVTT